MIEVELKFALPHQARAKLQEKLQSAEFVGTIHNVDIYYDTPAFDLLKQAVFVRIRNSGSLQIKFNEAIEKVHGQVTERTFPLSSYLDHAAEINSLFRKFLPTWSTASSFEEAVRKNKLVELVRINNERAAYLADGIHISVDHVEALGDFLEIEANYEEGSDTSHAVDMLSSFIADLNLQRVKTGYVELWLRIHNPRAYSLGKYQL